MYPGEIFPTLSKFFVKNEQARITRLSCRNNLLLPDIRTDIGCEAFSYSDPNFWNCLPVELKRIEKLVTFRYVLEKYSHIFDNHPT